MNSDDQQTATPRELAQAVRGELAKRSRVAPELEVLVKIFEVMYYTSLLTEESKPLTYQLIYLNPQEPDPEPPRRVVRDRWSFVRLTTPIAFTISEVKKIARSSDPRTSAFVVHPDESGDLFIWGFIDQQTRYQQFLNYDSRSGPERPGLFQALVRAIGNVAVYLDYERVAELKVARLQTGGVDVLSSGPIHSKLAIGATELFASVRHSAGDDAYQSADWDSLLANDWFSILRRLLLRVQSLGHGGSLLVVQSRDYPDIKVKYILDYDRMRTAVLRWAGDIVHRWDIFSREVHGGIEQDELVDVLRQRRTVERDIEESEDEIDAAIWFVSLLTRIDGAVLLTPKLEVLGFGAEILTREDPTSVARAIASDPEPTGLTSVDYQEFGTRHRSVMRFCNAHPDSIGFVVSQDGDVRAITKVGASIVYWENLRLQLDFPSRRGRQDSETN